MTATTTTWAIPYATSTDPFCSGADIIDSMADRVDALLVTFNAGLDRVVTVPYASISTTTAQTAGPFPSGVFLSLPGVIVQYDTVDEDTDNLTNLPTLPSAITIPVASGGYWATFTNMIGTDASGSQLEPEIAINGPQQDPGGSPYPGSTTSSVGGTTAVMLRFPVDAGTGPIQLFTRELVGNTTVVTTLNSATFVAFWVADE